jgi:hypothetical protein
MQVGDIIQIEGRLGFAIDPIRKVKDIKGGMVLLAKYPETDGGLLSHTNESWHGIDMIEGRFTPVDNFCGHQ